MKESNEMSNTHPKAVFECKKIAKKFGFRLVDKKKRLKTKGRPRSVDYVLYESKKGKNQIYVYTNFKTYEFFYNEETYECDDVTGFYFICKSAFERKEKGPREEEEYTGDDILEAVNHVIFKHDPMGLSIAVNKYEYYSYAGDACNALPNLSSDGELLDVVYQSFCTGFDSAAGEKEDYIELTREIWRIWRKFSREEGAPEMTQEELERESTLPVVKKKRKKRQKPIFITVD